MWSATVEAAEKKKTVDISTHALRVERDVGNLEIYEKEVISTHALRVERDSRNDTVQSERKHFNSRAPCGARQSEYTEVIGTITISTHALRVERDIERGVFCRYLNISTHALRVERDRGLRIKKEGKIDFNSRAPCGARLLTLKRKPLRRPFQLTRSVWSATNATNFTANWTNISTHALRVERDTTKVFEMSRI